MRWEAEADDGAAGEEASEATVIFFLNSQPRPAELTHKLDLCNYLSSLVNIL